MNDISNFLPEHINQISDRTIQGSEGKPNTAKVRFINYNEEMEYGEITDVWISTQNAWTIRTLCYVFTVI